MTTTQYTPIAKHFSSTRYKVWPNVAKFIDTFDKDSYNIELGCGNGKNILYGKNNNINIEGIDNCEEFVKICKDNDQDVTYGDILDLDHYNEKTYDNILCIAVLHHLKNHKDRDYVIQSIIKILKVGGQALITVWALEQTNTKFKFVHKDNIVKWQTKDKTYERYYYIYKKGELEDDFKKYTNMKYTNIKFTVDYVKGNHTILIKKLY